jgi:hypothetical protein
VQPLWTLRSVLSILGASWFAACSFPGYEIFSIDPLAAICTDRLPSSAETGVDCGGGCTPCGMGQSCRTFVDCESASCVDGVCQMPTCSDGVKNAAEVDVDCGGQCDPCGPGKDCLDHEDCADGVCATGFCQLPTCADGVRNADETAPDCAGGCEALCDIGMGCGKDGDCLSEHCSNEVCVAPSCTDGTLSPAETDVDCGGTACGRCEAGDRCLEGRDCTSSVCEQGLCTDWGCTDDVLNGSETDVDCGGENCAGCTDLERCEEADDCASRVCLSGVCVPSGPTGAALDRAGWKATCTDSYPDHTPDQFLDSAGGRWTSGKDQYVGMSCEIDMGKLETFFQLLLTCNEAPNDAPGKFDVYFSRDGSWGEPARAGVFGGEISSASFDTAQLARYVKIELTQDKAKWWSINELNVLK